MSAPSATLPPARRGGRSPARLWLALFGLIAAGVALAWLGAGSLRGETTASGLVFRTVEPGSGALIQPIDAALIEYEARLMDGTVFDTTEGRQPAPVVPSQMIPGFAEALTMMRKGGRYRVVVPGRLAYGANPPSGSPIPPDADLEFDVHVLEVAPGAGAMQGAPPQPQSQSQSQPQPQP